MTRNRSARVVSATIAGVLSMLSAGAVAANSLWADDCVFSFDPQTILETTDTLCVTGDIDTVPPGQIFPRATIYVVDVIFGDTFETGTGFQWSYFQPFCGTPHVGLRVEVTWQTPGDPDETDDVGTNLDLHILHPDAGGTWLSAHDCYRNNPAPDWGVVGVHENAVVILIDDDGAGPEIVQLTDPQSVSYDVGVHYFDDLAFGPSIATVKVWLNGVQVYEYPGKTLIDGEFWHLGSVAWPGGAFTGVDTVTAGIP